MCDLLTPLPATKAASGTVKQPLAEKSFQFKNSIKNRCSKENTMRRKPFPVVFCFLFEGMKFCNSCPCYLLAAGPLHVIALWGSLMQRKQSMEWAKEQVFSFKLSLAVARTVCCRCCDSEQAWRREAVSAHQHGWVWISVVYHQPANSMAFGESQMFSRHMQDRRLYSLVCWDDFAKWI